MFGKQLDWYITHFQTLFWLKWWLVFIYTSLVKIFATAIYRVEFKKLFSLKSFWILSFTLFRPPIASPTNRFWCSPRKTTQTRVRSPAAPAEKCNKFKFCASPLASLPLPHSPPFTSRAERHAEYQKVYEMSSFIFRERDLISRWNRVWSGERGVKRKTTTQNMLLVQTTRWRFLARNEREREWEREIK